MAICKRRWGDTYEIIESIGDRLSQAPDSVNVAKSAKAGNVAGCSPHLIDG